MRTNRQTEKQRNTQTEKQTNYQNLFGVVKTSRSAAARAAPRGKNIRVFFENLFDVFNEGNSILFSKFAKKLLITDLFSF